MVSNIRTNEVVAYSYFKQGVSADDVYGILQSSGFKVNYKGNTVVVNGRMVQNVLRGIYLGSKLNKEPEVKIPKKRGRPKKVQPEEEVIDIPF